MGEKIVTLDRLRAIYKTLIEMNRIKELKDELKDLTDMIALTEHEVSEFIKDLLGGTLYECERKLKEAENFIDKLAKKGIELNNGLNDFEMDVKKGIEANPDDKEINKEGKRHQDGIHGDRKELKRIEDDKNAIK